MPGAPLHLAAAYGKDRTVRILLEHHANVTYLFFVSAFPKLKSIIQSLDRIIFLTENGLLFTFSLGYDY